LAGTLTVIGAVCVARYVKPLSAADTGRAAAEGAQHGSALSRP
jgi:ACS family hexuronate transporter-like MFS transporter